MHVLVLYNEPLLEPGDADAAAEQGVLTAVEAACAAMVRQGHTVSRLAVRPAGRQLAQQLAACTADVVLNLCEAFGASGHGEAHVAGLLELCRIPFTGSRLEALALVRDKPRTKLLLRGAGLPTPDFYVVEPGLPLPGALTQPLSEPWLAKPACEDASQGIDQHSVTDDFQVLAKRVSELQQRYGPVMVERYIDGREFNVAVLAMPAPVVLPLAEIEFAPELQWKIVSYAAKWDAAALEYRQTPVRCPAQVDAELAAGLREVALCAFAITGLRHYGRIDVRIDRLGQIWILEVNGNPDLSPDAGLARALAASGEEYDRFLARLVEHAWAESMSERFGPSGTSPKAAPAYPSQKMAAIPRETAFPGALPTSSHHRYRA